jgi:hypothetical protein
MIATSQMNANLNQNLDETEEEIKARMTARGGKEKAGRFGSRSDVQMICNVPAANRDGGDV